MDFPPDMVVLCVTNRVVVPYTNEGPMHFPYGLNETFDFAENLFWSKCRILHEIAFHESDWKNLERGGYFPGKIIKEERLTGCGTESCMAGVAHRIIFRDP